MTTTQGVKGKKRTKEDIERMRDGWRKRFLSGGKSYGKENALKGREKIRDGKLGERNPMWKGSNVSYGGLHAWLQWQLGKPNTCKNCGKTGLTGRKIHWANISKKYLRSLSDWIRLCSKCHVGYDKGLIVLKHLK